MHLAKYTVMQVAISVSAIAISVYSTSVEAEPNVNLFNWTANINESSPVAGIQRKGDDIDAPYDGVVFRCRDGNIELTVGAISTAHLSKLFMKEEIPKFSIIVDDKKYDFENPTISYDEHDSIWNYQITDFNGLDFTTTMSRAKSMSIAGHGIGYKLPRDGQASLARFGSACRSIQDANKKCKLERILTGNRNIAVLQNYVSGSKTGYTTFLLRGADRDKRGVLRSEILGELTQSRVGYEISSAGGEKLGLLDFGDGKVDNWSNEQCSKLVTRRLGPGRLAIFKDGQRIGIISDEQGVIGRGKS